MPETAIHKDHESRLVENEVGFAEKVAISPPASDPLAPEKVCEHNLRISIAARPYSGHHF